MLLDTRTQNIHLKSVMESGGRTLGGLGVLASRALQNIVKLSGAKAPGSAAAITVKYINLFIPARNVAREPGVKCIREYYMLGGRGSASHLPHAQQHPDTDAPDPDMCVLVRDCLPNPFARSFRRLLARQLDAALNDHILGEKCSSRGTPARITGQPGQAR